MVQIDVDEVKRVSAEFSPRRLLQIGTPAEIRFRQAMENRREASQLFSTPLQFTFNILDTPVLIWQFPRTNLDMFIDDHVESMNNYVKISINRTSAGFDMTHFTFFFVWTNLSQFAAVVNVRTELVLTGLCEVAADSGVFSGHVNWLRVDAYLGLMRWSGWGTDPDGTPRDQTPFPFVQPTQHQYVADLEARGGGLFGESDVERQAFNFQSSPLSCDLIAIPAAATTLFEVSLLVSDKIPESGDSDRVIVDLGKKLESEKRVTCHFVALEVLTPLPVLTTT